MLHKLRMLLNQNLFKGGVPAMTLNLVFFSLTIKKREVNLKEAVHQEMVEKLYEQNKDRQISMYHEM